MSAAAGDQADPRVPTDIMECVPLTTSEAVGDFPSDAREVKGVEYVRVYAPSGAELRVDSSRGVDVDYTEDLPYGHAGIAELHDGVSFIKMHVLVYIPRAFLLLFLQLLDRVPLTHTKRHLRAKKDVNVCLHRQDATSSTVPAEVHITGSLESGANVDAASVTMDLRIKACHVEELFGSSSCSSDDDDEKQTRIKCLQQAVRIMLSNLSQTVLQLTTDHARQNAPGGNAITGAFRENRFDRVAILRKGMYTLLDCVQRCTQKPGGKDMHCFARLQMWNFVYPKGEGAPSSVPCILAKEAGVMWECIRREGSNPHKEMAKLTLEKVNEAIEREAREFAQA